MRVRHSVDNVIAQLLARLDKRIWRNRILHHSREIAGVHLSVMSRRGGTSVLPRPDRDERWVRGLFERAVGGFYGVVLTGQGWRVEPGGTRLRWPVERSTPGIGKVLPAMLADIVLEHRASGRRIVIDTKFTSILTRG